VTVPLLPSTCFLATQAFARRDILTDYFRPVPDDYLAFPEEGTRNVRIRCVCGAETDLSFGEMKGCDCGRVFYCGSKVYAAPPPEPEEHHACAPARVFAHGTYCLTDYCAECGADL
jgi:hypothetical protein